MQGRLGLLGSLAPDGWRIVAAQMPKRLCVRSSSAYYPANDLATAALRGIKRPAQRGLPDLATSQNTFEAIASTLITPSTGRGSKHAHTSSVHIMG